MKSICLLETIKLTKQFGGVKALNQFNFHLDMGELVGIIGPNGAGKTTLFNLIAGMLRPTSGEIRFKGYMISKRTPDQTVKLGIARTFQNIRLFGKMSVFENVLVSAYSKSRSSLTNAFFGGRASREEWKNFTSEAMNWLKFMGIDNLKDTRAMNLAYGDQRRLEIARAMATHPEVLLLDEPTCGMNPTEKADIMDHIRRLNNDGITVLLIEHDMKVVMGICKRIVVLDYGSKIAEGTSEEVRSNRAVIEAYLGRDTVNA